MVGLTQTGLVILGLLILALYLVSVTLTRALRTFSRSRLELLCETRNHPQRADEIAHQDERTERATEAVSVLSGLLLATLIVWSAATWPDQVGLFVALVLGLGALCHGAASVLGRVHAELLLDTLWPLTPFFRALAAPLLVLARAFEGIAERGARRLITPPRPASVEVEIHSTPENGDEDIEADLPESVRSMLEHVIELDRHDVAEVMTPRSAIVGLPASSSAEEAAQVFINTGRSRVPLFGENRDDVVGILYIKDLFAQLVENVPLHSIRLRDLVRPAHCVPETKNAAELLEEFRRQRVHIAVVLDEYGGISGLITLEDLFEEIVGPIDDEHDVPTPEDLLVPVSDNSFEVDATMPLEELNERLDLRLPTNGDFQTVGGFAFNTLGRLPEPGDSFESRGLQFTVLAVGDHSIRRLRIDLHPAGVERSAG